MFLGVPCCMLSSCFRIVLTEKSESSIKADPPPPPGLATRSPDGIRPSPEARSGRRVRGVTTGCRQPRCARPTAIPLATPAIAKSTRHRDMGDGGAPPRRAARAGRLPPILKHIRRGGQITENS
eukprot:scaffold19114_cov118-Isochrysis_galbana.AAC.14